MSNKLEDILLEHAARTLCHPQPYVKFSGGASLKLEDDVVQVFRGVLAKRALGNDARAMGWRSIRRVIESDYLGDLAAFSPSDLYDLSPRDAAAFLNMFLVFAEFRVHAPVGVAALGMLQRILEKSRGKRVTSGWPYQG